VSLRVILAQVAMLVALSACTACSRPRSTEASGAAQGTARLSVAGLAAEEAQREPLRPGETTPAIEQRAKAILDANREASIGTELPFEIDGRRYLARIEEHYHEPGGPRRPWGRHRGVTVYRAE